MRISCRDSSHKLSIGRSQSGQAVTELILLISITILIFLGGIYQLNDAFRHWANNYFGDYLACLLETGELPNTSGDGGGPQFSCSNQYEAFSIANGRPAKEGQSGGGGSSSNPSGNQPKEPKARGTSEGAAANYGNGGSSGSKSGGVPNSDGSFNTRDSDSKSAGRGKNKSQYTGSTEDSIPGSVKRSSKNPAQNRRDRSDRGFYVTRNERLAEAQGSTVTKTTVDDKPERRERFVVKRKLAKVDGEAKEEPMSLGDYLRYILIIGIIIALVLVFGGQILKMSKEME